MVIETMILRLWAKRRENLGVFVKANVAACAGIPWTPWTVVDRARGLLVFTTWTVVDRSFY